MKIDERLCRNLGRANFHSRTRRQVKHPRHDNDCSARCNLDDDNISSRSLLVVKPTHEAPVMRVPAVMDLHFRSDMGRITLRL
jgi:hypothetical protein